MMTATKSNTELCAIAEAVARSAGEMVRTSISSPGEISFKPLGDHNLVTEIDLRSEDLIKSEIEHRAPGTKFLAEETGGDAALDDLTWVIDPIDGTVNFAHGIPLYCVSIAAVIQNEPVAGAIYNPNTDEMFTAVKDGGAFLNGTPIHVSDTDSLDRAILVTGFPYNVADNPHGCIDSFADFLTLGVPVRRLGSAAVDLAYTAAGRFDGFWEVDLNAWDVAAGALMVVEAGGEMTTYGNHAVDGLIIVDRMIATNGRITDSMRQILANPGAWRR